MILVVAEHQNGRLKPITNELLTFAQRAGRDLELPVSALVVSSNAEDIVGSLKSVNIARILTVDPATAEFSPERTVQVLKSLIERGAAGGLKEKLAIMVQASAGMGFVHAEDIDGTYEIEVSGTRVPARASLKAPFA